MKLNKCMTIVTSLSNLVFGFKFILVTAFAYLGFFESQEGEEEVTSSHNDQVIPDSHVLIMEGSCPSLVPVQMVISLIKRRVPIVEYSRLLERNVDNGRVHEGGCAICLSCIERSDEVRELLNCCHVFHRECLDCWIEESQVTCPLCRSMLLPALGRRV